MYNKYILFLTSVNTMVIPETMVKNNNHKDKRFWIADNINQAKAQALLLGEDNHVVVELKELITHKQTL